MLKDSVDIKKRRSKTEPKENLASEAKKKKERERNQRASVRTNRNEVSEVKGGVSKGMGLPIKYAHILSDPHISLLTF